MGLINFKLGIIIHFKMKINTIIINNNYLIPNCHWFKINFPNLKLINYALDFIILNWNILIQFEDEKV